MITFYPVARKIGAFAKDMNNTMKDLYKKTWGIFILAFVFICFLSNGADAREATTARKTQTQLAMRNGDGLNDLPGSHLLDPHSFRSPSLDRIKQQYIEQWDNERKEANRNRMERERHTLLDSMVKQGREKFALNLTNNKPIQPYIHIYGNAKADSAFINDSLVLVGLYNSTQGQNWTNKTNWLTHASLSSWFGVTVDSGRVTEIKLHMNHLVGSLPLQLGTLSNLHILYLFGNQLSGSIPSELGNLRNLQELHIGVNHLSGSIPVEFGNLTHLQRFNVSLNLLTGTIPFQLGNLTSLWELDLSSNQLSGSIPPQLTNLTNLKYFNLSQNELSGSIPSQLGNLANIKLLYLHYNQLSGTIPIELANLTHLEGLALSNNQLSGAIPPELGNLDSLETLQLSFNQLSGNIPVQIGNLTNLKVLDLSVNQLTGSILPIILSLTNLRDFNFFSNQFTGTIPPQIGSLTNLRNIDLDANYFSGTIPPELGNLINLTSLSISENQFSGIIPPELGNLTNLILLRMNDNGLSGSIPASLGNLLHLDIFELIGNQLSGSIPASLGNLTNVSQLLLDGNQLSGPIPPSLGNLINLHYLWLNNNQLSGAIPTSFGNLVNILQFRLWSNQFSGSLPASLGNLSNLEVFILSNNQMSGIIPSTFGNLGSLQFLWLDGNQISGPIPSSLGNLGNLHELMLYGNQLTGTLPPELGNLTNLQVLLLRANQIEGAIPASFGNLGNMWAMDLQKNQLTGSIPSSFGNLTNLKYIWLDSNQLSGSIPPELGNLTIMKMIDLDDNQLSGSIPAELGNLSQLYLLSLYSNQLTGKIPTELSHLTNLQHLWIHKNQLSGAVPIQFINFVNLQSFSVFSNGFTDLPKLNVLPSFQYLYADNNKFTFKDIEPNIGIDSFSYAPQDSLGDETDMPVHLNQQVQLSALAGGTATHYQWYRNGISLPGKTSSILTIPSASVSDTGSYICRVSNTIAKRLSLASRPTKIRVPPATVTITATTGSNGAINPSGAVIVNSWGNYAFTITPIANYRIDSVIVDNVMVDSTRSYTFINVTEDHTIRAVFTNRYILTTNTTHGNVTLNPAGGKYLPGTQVVLTANPSTGYHFGNWSGDVTGSKNPDTLTMNGNTTVTANFAVNTYTITVNATNGYVLINPPDIERYGYGTRVILTAIPAEGYHFDYWNAGPVETTNPETLAVDGDKIIIANFAINTYSLTVHAENGAIVQNPNQMEYNHGSKVVLTATPATGYHFVNWNGDITGNNNPDTLTMDGNKEVTAHFAVSITQYILIASGGVNGTIFPTDTTVVYDGTMQQYTFTPNAGYGIDSVIVDGVRVATSPTYTFNNISDSHTIRVTFTPIRYYRTFGIDASLSTKAGKLNKKGKKALTPTVGNWRDTVFNRYDKKNGMQLGITDRNFGWLRFNNGMGFSKFYTTIDTLKMYNAPFDTVRKFGSRKKKVLLKEFTPTASTYTNPIAQAFGLFKLNLHSSIKQITPTGLDSLFYVSEGSPYHGMSLAQIANRVDTVLTRYTTKPLPGNDMVRVGSAALETLRELLNRVNEAFNTPISLTNGDSINGTGALTFGGTIGINQVSYLVRNPAGKVEPLNAYPIEDFTPEIYTLEQNYPNPFNPVTVIGFRIPDYGLVSLKVYDVLGREVATLINNETMEEGTHEISFDASHLSSGVYFYRLTATNGDGSVFMQAKKLVLMK